ncbi:uncharacterized protein LOC117109668 [Anneissia japonica]|uniref:uncharacterized protein LOC117109668 n=1 Tax=Anneissia japonica TaxID=1529436 RepID=UPI001425BB17|nr:uncharacterized protein LOC117109668 [Anneissia japonica]
MMPTAWERKENTVTSTLSKKCTCVCLWRKNVATNLNKIAVATVFRHKHPSLIIGCDDGVLRIYTLPTDGDKDQDTLQMKLSLETKGGPIQTLMAYDVSKLGSTDLITADSRGMVTIFCNGQISARKSLSKDSVNCLQIDDDATGNFTIIASDGAGVIHGFMPYSHLWMIRLADMPIQKNIPQLPRIKCLLATSLIGASGQESNYVIASDDCKNLHFLQQGTVVVTLTCQSIITAMCKGYFVPSDELELTATCPETPSQVALGAEDGSVYIMCNFQIYFDEYTNVKLPIKQLAALPGNNSSEVQNLVCTGNFNHLVIYHAKKLVAKYETSDWVCSLTVAAQNQDGSHQVIVGCCNNVVEAIKIS